MDGGTADFYGDDWIKESDGSLEWSEEELVVGEDAVMACFYAKTDACCDGFFCGSEPCFTLGLGERVSKSGSER